MDRRRLGESLYTAGTLALPLGIGAAGGYWIADAGARWVPTTLGALLVVGVLGLALLAAGSSLTATQRSPKTKRFLFFTLLAFLAAVLRLGVWWASTPTPLATRDHADFLRVFRDDVKQVSALAHALDDAGGTIAASVPRQGVLSADAEQVVADAWAGYVHASFALDQVRRYYEDYYKLDLSRLERTRHTLSFLLTFAAELALFERTLLLESAVSKNASVEKFLDLPRPKHDLPGDSYSTAKEELLGVSDYSRIVAGKKYMAYLATLHEVDREVRAAGFDALWSDVTARLERLEEHPKVAVAFDSVTSDFAPIQRKVKHFAFPVQKEVAEWMGDTRVRRAGHYLVDDALQAKLQAELRPGDVMLARKNWYLSNIGLPGFWPHAMLYAGTRAQIAEAFDADPEVKAYVASLGHAGTFSTFLETRFVRVWRLLDDQPIVEAVSEGVVVSDMHHAAGDYVAALRPRLRPVDKAKAIVRALSLLGRPYDFDFDFATDHAVVCTELVWRSYRAHEGEPGLRLPLSRIAGRLTLPANEIARVFRDEGAGEDRQFDFVAFVEGREHQQDAVEGDAEALAATVDRSKWDFGQP